MNFFKKYLDDKYTKISIYSILTFTVLCAIYVGMDHIPEIAKSISNVFRSIISAIMPLIIGLIIAYLLHPISNFIEFKAKSCNTPFKPKTIRIMAVALTLILIMALVLLLIFGAASLVLGQIVIGDLSQTIENLKNYLESSISSLEQYVTSASSLKINADLDPLIKHSLTWLSENISFTSIGSFAKSFGNGILNAFLGVILAIYLLIDREFFLNLWKTGTGMIFNNSLNDSVHGTLNIIHVSFGKFIRGQLLDCMAVASIASVSLSILGLDYAIVIGTIAGVFNIIPYFGPIIGMIPAAIVGLFSGEPIMALWAVLILWIVQYLDSALISPRLVGSTTGMHPVFVLLSVTIGGYFFGILGMLLAVPVGMSIIEIVCKKLLSKCVSAHQ